MSTQNKINLKYNKDTELLSTKISTKDNFLDYTFLSHRSQISKQKTNDVNKSKDYIYDLLKTWDLNIDLMENLINEKKYSGLLEIIKSLRKYVEKKNNLMKEVSKIKGRILIERQIVEELKRKNEENEEYYKDQIKEHGENENNKEEYIKIFEKKLKEVEIYIQKNTKNKSNSKFEIYKDFKISEFIVENTDLIRTRDILNKDLNDANMKKNEIQNENANLQQELQNFSFANNTNIPDELGLNKITVSHKFNEKTRLKLKKYYDTCKNQVRILEMRNSTLKSYFDDMSTKLKYFNFNDLKRYVKKESKQRKYSVNLNNYGEDVNENLKDKQENLNDKSIVNLDVTRKFGTLMDFSVILNKKQSTDDTNIDFGLNKTGLGHLGNELWDISCIGKY